MPQIFMPLKALPMELDESFTPVEAINKILFKLNESIDNINNLYEIKFDKFIGTDKVGYFIKVNANGYAEAMESSGTAIQWGDITGLIEQQTDMINLIASMINTAISPIQTAIGNIQTTIGTWTSTLGTDIATAIGNMQTAIGNIQTTIGTWTSTLGADIATAIGNIQTNIESISSVQTGIINYNATYIGSAERVIFKNNRVCFISGGFSVIADIPSNQSIGTAPNGFYNTTKSIFINLVGGTNRLYNIIIDTSGNIKAYSEAIVAGYYVVEGAYIA